MGSVEKLLVCMYGDNNDDSIMYLKEKVNCYRFDKHVCLYACFKLTSIFWWIFTD